MAFLLLVGLQLSGCTTDTGVYDQAPGAGQLTFDADAMLRVAERLRDGGDYMAALRMYRQVREQDPENVGALTGEGELLLMLGAVPDAEQRFRAARSLGDKSADTTAALARTLLRQDKAAEALVLYDEVLEGPDVSARAYNGYGVALDLLGRHDDAQLAYGSGLDLDPGNVLLTNNLALSFALSGSYGAGIRILSDLVATRPDAAGARQNLALIYGLSGDMGSAEKVAAIDLDRTELAARMAYINDLAEVPENERARAIILGVMPQKESTPQTEQALVVPSKVTQAPVSEESVPQMNPNTDSALNDADPVEQGSGVEALTEGEASAGPDVFLNGIRVAQEPLYLVQLGAYLDQDQAMKGWRAVARKAPDLLGDHEPNISVLETEKDGAPHRIVRMGIVAEDGFKAAEAYCGKLKTAGVDCLVRRLQKQP